jgi:asparagine synthetase B (glutamine-hydrolysing)
VDLRKGELKHRQFQTICDSEVIVHLYEEYGTDFCDKLDGIFAFMIFDNDRFMAGLDQIGVKPLYYGTDKEGNMYFASEMKAICNHCETMEAFPPGHYYTPDNPYLPEEILCRQKEQFSDGVGYNWIDSLKEYCNNIISDIEYETAATRFSHNKPETKEAFYFR